MQPDIWLNGIFVPWEDASIHPLCFSMQRGATVFESIDCNEHAESNAALFRSRDHFLRFDNSARIIGMSLPYSVDELCDAATATVARSGLKHVVIRPIAYYDAPVMQVYPEDSPVSVAIGVTAAHTAPETMNVTIAGLRKIDSTSMPVKAKVSANYIGPMIAKQNAIRDGFDDAVILDRDGFVAEGTTANIFIVEDGTLVTAPDDTILPGITRDSITRLAERLDIPVRRDMFTPDRLLAADEVIICSSGRGVTAAVRIEDTVIGDGGPGPVTKQLRTLYRRVVTGREPDFAEWLTLA
jgi:branched-chain amino acid aminotransferase